MDVHEWLGYSSAIRPALSGPPIEATTTMFLRVFLCACAFAAAAALPVAPAAAQGIADIALML